MISLAAPPPRPPKFRLSRRARIALILLGFVLPFLAAQVVVAHLFTQRFARSVEAGFNRLPSTTELVSFQSSDGLILSGWYLPPVHMPARAPAPAVVLLHGHGGDRRQMIARAQLMTHLGYASLLYDARAHGESGGTRTSIGYHEKHDLAGALAYLRSRGHRDMGCIGMSQGAATIALAAAELTDVRWAVLESCYTSLEETFDQRCRVNFGLPRQLIAPSVLPAARWLLDLPSGLPSPMEAAKNFRCPVLVLCGEADPFISSAQTRALYDAIPSPKTLHLTPAAGHIDLHRRDPEAYEERLRVFLADQGGGAGG